MMKGRYTPVCAHLPCVCTGMRCWLAGWRVSGQAWINKLHVSPICSPALLITTLSPRSCSDNRPRYRRSKKYYIVKQLIEQLLVYFTALWVQICIICLFKLVGHCRVGKCCSYFCLDVMIYVEVFAQCRQTNAGSAFLWSVGKAVLGMGHTNPLVSACL